MRFNMKNHIFRLALFTALFTLISCGFSEITKTIITECQSPDGQYIAQFYVEQSGGAAGSQYEFLSIKEKGNSNSTE